MKLTLHINDNIAPKFIQILGNLLTLNDEPVADPCPGHPELSLMPVKEQYRATLAAQRRLSELGNPDLAAKWVEAGGDVPPTQEQLAALAAPTRHDDEDPALADVRWQATPEPTPANCPDCGTNVPTVFEHVDECPDEESEPTPEPDPWDLPTSTDAEPAGFAAGTNGKLEVVALDETNPDLTQRVLSWPQELLSIPLPEKPEGKTKWVYRGTFGDVEFETEDRDIYYLDELSHWKRTTSFSTVLHHIEAI